MWLPIDKKASSLSSKNLRNIFCWRRVLNLIHVNKFGCLARDLNLTVFSMVIFHSTFKRRFPSAFYNIGRCFQSC